MRRILLPLMAVLLFAGCSSGDETAPDDTASEAPAEETGDAAAEPDDDAAEQDAAPAADDAAAADSFGSFTVEGDEFVVRMVIRCTPFRDEPGNLDLQAMSEGPQLNVVVDGGAGGSEISVQGGGLTAAYGSIAFGVSDDEVEVDVADGRVSGSGTLSDAQGSGTTVDVTFDVEVPETAQDC